MKHVGFVVTDCRSTDVVRVEFTSLIGHNSMVFSIRTSRKFTRVNVPLLFILQKEIQTNNV